MPRLPVALAVILAGLAGCGPVLYPERAARWHGSKKKTLAAVEEAVRAAMAAPGVKKVDAPGNEEPVMIDPGRSGVPGCVTSAWFTVDGNAKEQLGGTFHYAWYACAGEGKASLRVNCLEVRRAETSVESRECARVAAEVARRSDRLVRAIDAP